MEKKEYLKLLMGGHFFLDEIGDISSEMQTKLLKVIQDKKFHRVGGYDDIEADVNIISATNKDLYEMVQEGKFREDLYYRLNVIPIDIPPLRDRQEDILVLIEYFLNNLINVYEEEKYFSKEALDLLYNYSWPGNIRELKNMIERTYILTNSQVIGINNLPNNIIESNKKYCYKRSLDMDLNKSLEKLEMELISEAIEETKNNKEAAKLLGIHPSTLTRKRQKYLL